MSIPEWPLALRFRPRRSSWGYVPGREALQTETEGGDTRHRRRPGDDVGKMKWGRTFTASEMAVWRAFLTTTSGGAARFLMPVPTDGATYETRVVQIVGGLGGISYASIGIDTEVTCTLTVFPADMVPFGGLDFAYPVNSQYTPLCF